MVCRNRRSIAPNAGSPIRFAHALAERDLSHDKIWGEHIAIGAATDPYQPAEREFGATRAILAKMAEREGLSVSITTKSDRSTTPYSP